MSLEKTDPFYLSNFPQLCCDIRFDFRHLSLDVCLLGCEDMLHNDDSKSLTFILILLIPPQHSVLVLFSQCFFHFSLLFRFSLFILLVFLVEVRFLYFYNKTIPDFASI